MIWFHNLIYYLPFPLHNKPYHKRTVFFMIHADSIAYWAQLGLGPMQSDSRACLHPNPASAADQLCDLKQVISPLILVFSSSNG